MGEHQLKPDLPSFAIYQALSVGLQLRLMIQGSIRSQNVLEHGVLNAPVGQLTICFMHVVGAATLLQWDSRLTRKARDFDRNIRQTLCI